MSSSVNVGSTDFPLRPAPLDRSPVPAFTKSVSSRPSAFRLLDGPPYANGAPHLGHVLNKHLKDAVARAVNAQGGSVEWRPGWDCHGLPLELAVEKQGVARSDRSQFVAAARNFASEQASLQSSVFQQQGWSAQWGEPWHTQDPHMEAGTLRVLADLMDKGAVDVRFTALPWCAQCGSTLSNAEQEDKPLSSTAWLVPFALSDAESLLSWTTTPWTLPLHRALVVNANATYVALHLNGKVAWVSQDTSEDWAKQLGAVVSDDTCLGSSLVDKTYQTPWSKSKVSADNAVLPDAGTGVLHAVPGLSELDTELGDRHGWEVLQHLSPRGEVLLTPCLEQEAKRAGPAANAPVRAYYEASPWFLELPYNTQHPHCWRHHTPLLTRASRQVFLGLSTEVRARAQAMLEQVEFSPAPGRARLSAAMRDRPHWCLSRQRTWGVPLALFLDRETGQPHAMASTFMRRVADAMEQQGVEAWWSQPSETWLGQDASLEEVERVDDVLDVWFDSGCVPQLVGAADVVVEGSDQHRGWFQSCVWVAAALDVGLPFKRVATHGFVVDQSGQKLSKSKGGDKKTTVAPWHTMPTDVVRVWALSGTDGNDKAWTQDTVQLSQGYLSRWRGVLRFLVANALPTPATCDLSTLPAWDRYWWNQCEAVSTEVVSLVAKAQFGEAVSRLAKFGEAFSSYALGSWKDRLYCAPSHTVERQALDVVVRQCLRHWGLMMEVMAPRMRQDAQAFWPEMTELLACPPLPTQEREEVEHVLAVRVALGPHAEAMSKQVKGGSGLRRLRAWEAAPQWPGQLLADAMDVGQVVGYEDEVLTMVEVVVSHAPLKLFMGLSCDPQCHRCRRAQPAAEGQSCATCQEREAG